jgi:hypothetical protein
MCWVFHETVANLFLGRTNMFKAAFSAFALVLFVQHGAIAEDQNECSASGGLTFVCGVKNAEDLVLVPETHWVLSSGMESPGGLYLVDSVQKTSKKIYEGATEQVRQDTATYGACDGPPALENFVTHGLNIRSGENGHSILNVVAHGARETIEVFDVDASGAEPTLTWIGCVAMPEGLAANSVASLKDGSLFATVLMHPGDTFIDVFSGKTTGAVYQWSPGDAGFEKIQGTELPGNNGIEVSDDEHEIFVVSTGLRSISVFSNSNPSTQLRTTPTLDFGPDNLHRTVDGQLITGGPGMEDQDCGELDTENFDIVEFASCPRPSAAATLDPQTLAVTPLATAPANPDFSNATMALQVGDEVWFGTFSGDRIGVASKAP